MTCEKIFLLYNSNPSAEKGLEWICFKPITIPRGSVVYDGQYFQVKISIPLGDKLL